MSESMQGLSGSGLSFAKGHGTENDFVIIPDERAQVALPAERVRLMCDRRAGIGGDGLLRVVRAGALAEAGEISALPEGVAAEDWFMDYRNADGSIAEMCGNGVRVFAHWLVSRGLVEQSRFVVGTRAGAREITVHEATDTDARVTVGMGPALVTGVSTAAMGEFRFAGVGVDVGNPHLAAVIPGLTPDEVPGLPLAAPSFDRGFFPEGVNVEVLTPLVDGAVTMRVWERGVGETRSCGTGTVAAARAALADAGQEDGRVVVHVPGGEVVVTLDGATSTLMGPSRIVATGTTAL